MKGILVLKKTYSCNLENPATKTFSKPVTLVLKLTRTRTLINSSTFCLFERKSKLSLVSQKIFIEFALLDVFVHFFNVYSSE